MKKPEGEPFIAIWLDFEKGVTIVRRQEMKVPLEGFLSAIGVLGKAIEKLVEDATLVVRT